MRNACDSDSRCGLACDASARDAKSLAMWVERCEPLSHGRSMLRLLQDNADIVTSRLRWALNHTVVTAEFLVRMIAAIRITSVRCLS